MHKGLVLFLPLLICSVVGSAQLPEFLMSDFYTNECDAILFDSGGDGAEYGLNENLTFTVETGDPINIQFLEEVCIETDFDFLYVYDGLDDTAPLLAEISGFDFIPTSLIANSGAVTFVFTSDGSAGYCGFRIQWSTNATPPIPPTIDIPLLSACNSSQIDIEFSFPIGCTSLFPDSATVNGDFPIEVNSITFDCVDDSISTATLQVNTTIDVNCDYLVDLVVGMPDECDSIWVYHVAQTFTQDQCSFDATITQDPDEICSGQCTNIEVITEGCFTYSYQWTPALPPSAGPHQVCPLVNTTYEVEITEIETGNTEIFSIDIDVTNAGIDYPDGSLCQSIAGFEIPVSQEDGLWFGPGIQDEETGFFEPDSALTGSNILYYVLSPTCYDSVIIDIIPIDVGLTTAACPGSPAFNLGGVPSGGTWSGDFTLPDGTFDPQMPGIYEPEYMVNGCSEVLTINVEDILGSFDPQNLCQSIWEYTLDFEPFGGTWTGPGITDDYYGVFNPNSAPPGTFDLIYEINGCSQTLEMTIREINTGRRVRTSCPSQDPYIPFESFTPSGGIWEGLGIINSQSGLYDPGIVPNDTWTGLIYSVDNGCSDTIFIFNKQTDIPLDTAYMCIDNDLIPLIEDEVGQLPRAGVWTGNGVTNPFNDDYYEFNPQLSGIGDHLLTYEVNGCIDTVRLYVFPTSLQEESFAMCSNQAPFELDPSVNLGGTWTGPGITDNTTGLFDPNLAPEGDFYVVWSTPAACSDSIQISIETFEQASIESLEDTYCFENNSYTLDFSPNDGIISGALESDQLNPSALGEGSFELTYEYNGDYCMSDTTTNFIIYPPLAISLTAVDTVLCNNSGTTISAEGAGGFPDANYTFTWSDNLLSLVSNSVTPENTKYYYVAVDDGCSDTQLDSILISVLPPILPEVSLSDTTCFGEAGFAEANVLQAGNYSIQWDGLDENPFNTTAGDIVDLTILDIDQGCEFDSLVFVPSYTPISAGFSSNPNDDCIPWELQPIQFIDLSYHGLSGLWDFGNGEIANYDPTSNPSLTYGTPGQYTVTLYIENEGECADSTAISICIEDPARIFVPDIFSPNNDGLNDLLFVRGRGLSELNFQIFDRWGERIFESQDVDFGWDGRFRGSKMPTGVYVYMLSAKLSDGTILEQNGDITLVR